MGIFSSIGKVFKKVAPAALSFIPGVGPALGAAASVLGNKAGGVADSLFSNDNIAAGLGNVTGALAGSKIDRNNNANYMGDKYDFWSAQGATPQEILGSPAAGGNPTTAMGQTLGNAGGQMALRNAQMKFQAQENEKNRLTELAKSKLSADASIASSTISADANRYGSDKTAETAANQLAQNWRIQTDASLPKLSADLRLTEQQILKAANDAQTSSAEFVRQMKLWGMSPQNVMSAMLTAGYPIDMDDVEGSLKRMDPDVFNRMFIDILAATSTAAREAAGVSKTVQLQPDLIEEGARGWLRYLDDIGAKIFGD